MFQLLKKRKVLQPMIEKTPSEGYPEWLAYEPSLIPPPALMWKEGIVVLEEWFRWAEEWSMILRVYGRLTQTSRVLEIGCGLGRIAYALRYLLHPAGEYRGFEICQDKVEFLKSTFEKAHPNFKFTWADLYNTYYNPSGSMNARDYVFPYEDEYFDVIYAASVFTHMHPDVALNYFRQTARVLKNNGRAVFSFFLLDFYRKEQERRLGFTPSRFNFDYTLDKFENDVRISNPKNVEEMTSYRLSLLEKYADECGLVIVDHVPGFWSGSSETWVGAQDLVIIEKRKN